MTMINIDKKKFSEAYTYAVELYKEEGDRLLLSCERTREHSTFYNTHQFLRPLNHFRRSVNRFIYTCAMLKLLSKPSGRILEVGVTPGHMTAVLPLMGYDMYGIDIDPERCDEKLVEIGKIKKCDIESENIPFEDNAFDVVLLCEVLEHLRMNPLVMIREIKRVLKPLGMLIMTTPNRTKLESRIKMLFGDSDIESPYGVFERVEKHGHAGHIRLYTFTEIDEMLSKEGLTDNKVVYFDYKKKVFAGRDQYGIYRKLTLIEMFRRISGFIRPRNFFNLWIAVMQGIYQKFKGSLFIISTKPAILSVIENESD